MFFVQRRQAWDGTRSATELNNRCCEAPERDGTWKITEDATDLNPNFFRMQSTGPE
jgi:hypothetical protein